MKTALTILHWILAAVGCLCLGEHIKLEGFFVLYGFVCSAVYVMAIKLMKG